MDKSSSETLMQGDIYFFTGHEKPSNDLLCGQEGLSQGSVSSFARRDDPIPASAHVTGPSAYLEVRRQSGKQMTSGTPTKTTSSTTWKPCLPESIGSDLHHHGLLSA